MDKKPQISSLGRLIRHWRRLKDISQEELATRAGLSTRHLSRLETGRAQATRDSVRWISEALEIPESERAAFLEAADFVGEYQPLAPNTSDEASHHGRVMAAMTTMLDGHEPFPAFAHNHQGKLLAMNATFEWLMTQYLGPLSPEDALNGHALLFGPNGLRKNLANWPEFALFYVRRVHAELVRGGTASPELRDLFDWLVEATGLDPVEAAPARAQGTSPTLRWHLQRPETPATEGADLVPALDLDLKAVTVTLGTPQDQSLRDVRLVLMYPNESETEARLADRD